MSSIKRILPMLPFVIVCIIAAFNLYELVMGQYIVPPKHIAAYVLIVINFMVYFWKKELALLLTGLTLFLSTFSWITFFMITEENSYFVKMGNIKISTPSIHLLSLLLLMFFTIVNFALLKACYKKILG